VTAGNGGLDTALTEAAQYFKQHTKRWSFWLCEDLLDAPTRRKSRQVCTISDSARFPIRPA